MGKKILVVDDSIFMLQQIKDSIENTEFEVIGYAKDGETAIEMYDDVKPDIITLDIIMPGMDGVETALKLKAEHPDVHIIMMSSLGDDDVIDQLVEIGINQFICKPFEKAHLIEELRKF